MPHIKEISKCRRIPKEKQSSGSGESIDDENTVLDDDFLKMRKLFKESQDQKFIRRLKTKLKENLLKQKNEDSSEPSSDTELSKVKYPDPLPKIDKNKKTRPIEGNSTKKPGGHSNAKPKPLSKPLKRKDDLGMTTTDGSNNTPSASFNRKTAQQNKDDTKDYKSDKYDKKTDIGKKMYDEWKKTHKKTVSDVPLTKNDRDLTKNEIEAMIRTVLRQSRAEDGGDMEEDDDVSLGLTESTPSDDELDIGKDPEMSSTPDDISGAVTLSDDEEKNLAY